MFSKAALRMRTVRTRRIAAGVCIKCGGNRDRHLRICAACFVKQSKWKKNGRKKRAPKEKAYHSKRWANRIIVHSKLHDKKYKRTYAEEYYIDPDFLIERRKKRNNQCIYCGIPLQSFNRKRFNGVTVQRLNNRLAHIKDNCVIACFQCNNFRMELENPKSLKRMEARKTWNIISCIIRSLRVPF